MKLGDEKSERDVILKGLCELIEISGSESLMHLKIGEQRVIALIGRRLSFDLEGKELEVYVRPEEVFIFSPEGKFITKLSEG